MVRSAVAVCGVGWVLSIAVIVTGALAAACVGVPVIVPDDAAMDRPDGKPLALKV
jgi:hypothetical protein